MIGSNTIRKLSGKLARVVNDDLAKIRITNKHLRRARRAGLQPEMVMENNGNHRVERSVKAALYAPASTTRKDFESLKFIGNCSLCDAWGTDEEIHEADFHMDRNFICNHCGRLYCDSCLHDIHEPILAFRKDMQENHAEETVRDVVIEYTPSFIPTNSEEAATDNFAAALVPEEVETLKPENFEDATKAAFDELFETAKLRKLAEDFPLFERAEKPEREVMTPEKRERVMIEYVRLAQARGDIDDAAQFYRDFTAFMRRLEA